MADISIHTQRSVGRSGLWHDAGRAVLNIIHKFQTYNSKKRAEIELMSLDDRMLADIGVQRSEIRSRVWESDGK